MTVTDNKTKLTSKDAFWLQSALKPLTWLYGAAAFFRRKLYTTKIIKPEKLPCPVISIGNLTTGGTGKTPMTIFVATLLKEAGLSPLIISRGYKGSATRTGGIVSDGRNILMHAGLSGDEPLLMAERLAGVPVAVGRNRSLIATEGIRQFSPDVILLDDGFQHFQLARDIDIVLMDTARPLGNNRLLPAGPLREPLTALKAADIIIFTRADKPADIYPNSLTERIKDKPQFSACHVPFISAWIPEVERDLPEIDTLDQRRAFVFCGLADNESFLNNVRRLTSDVTGHRFFRDHHDFTASDLTAISAAAQEKKADIIITSAKDYVKFRDKPMPDVSCDLVVLDVAISFKDRADRFNDLIKTQLASVR